MKIKEAHISELCLFVASGVPIKSLKIYNTVCPLPFPSLLSFPHCNYYQLNIIWIVCVHASKLIIDQKHMISLCEAVRANPTLQQLKIRYMGREAFLCCFEKIAELLSNNYSLMKIVIVVESGFDSTLDDKFYFDWVTDRNKSLKKQQRFKSVKLPAGVCSNE